MRRKSERTKEKEKSSPEKKTEKTPRRSRRQSRRRKRSASMSPERDESGAEENEPSLRSSQEDTEEEQAGNLEETSSQVGAVITADITHTSEVEEATQSVSTRSRRSIKKNTTESVVPVEEESPATVKADTSHENEWKEDTTFWEDTEMKTEASDSKHKEKEGRSPVWKVKSADGGGGEIQKLKLCIVRPQEPSEPPGRKRKRLSRSSTSQTRDKSDNDDNDSSKGSQEHEEESADEKNDVSKSQQDQENTEHESTDIKNLNTSENTEERAKSDNEPEPDAIEKEVEIDVSKTNTETQEKKVNPDEEEDTVADEVKECPERISKEENENQEENIDENIEVKESSSVLDSAVVESSETVLSESHVSPSSDDTSNVNNVHETEQTDKQEEKTEASKDEEKEKNVEEISSSVVCETETEFNSDVKSSGRSPSSNENIVEVNDDLSAKDKTEEDTKSNFLKDHNFRSPKHSSDTDHVKSDVTENDVLKVEKSESSEDEKDSPRNDGSKDSSPRFRDRCADRLRIKEQETSPDESEQRNVENLPSSKHRRHSERKSRSPQRREKISLRRSFSGKISESDQVEISQSKREKSDIKDKILQENKENEAGKAVGESDSASTGSGVPRKRRWGQSNSSRPSKKPVLSISTDSLKTLIPGAKPVPIGEVQLIQEDEVKREEPWENDKLAEKEKPKVDVKEDRVLEKTPLLLPDASRISVAVTDDHQNKIVTRKISIVSDDARTLQRSPSPPRHKATNVLFITNLVRPFTLNQLKELLARTGKIIEGGFWIDKIKSKCYVEYEKETEAKETRHALHGVRWPVSNPKTLCVDFGKKEDMEMAQAVAESDQIPRKTEPLKVERGVDGWVVDQMREKEREREVREREKEKERERERERVRGKERVHHVPTEVVEHSKKVVVREWDLGKIGQTSPVERDTRYDEKNREKERKIRKEKPHRSRSASPHDGSVRKVKKKEEDAPAKLLDDLFRKTKTTPCIYWLPLTAEQIVVKEEMRRKHMAEHERRMAEMRKAERERERVRAQQRQQRRASEREKRRRRSGSGSPKK